jgi:hypothetical protein
MKGVRIRRETSGRFADNIFPDAHNKKPAQK